MGLLPEAKRLRLKVRLYHAGSWSGLPVRGGCIRRSSRLPPAFERLDDDHASAAAGAWRAEVLRFYAKVATRTVRTVTSPLDKLGLFKPTEISPDG